MINKVVLDMLGMSGAFLNVKIDIQEMNISGRWMMIVQVLDQPLNFWRGSQESGLNTLSFRSSEGFRIESCNTVEIRPHEEKTLFVCGDEGASSIRASRAFASKESAEDVRIWIEQAVREFNAKFGFKPLIQPILIDPIWE